MTRISQWRYRIFSGPIVLELAEATFFTSIFSIMFASIPGQLFAADIYPAEVASTELGHGTRLTDAGGFTLYQYQNDLTKPGTSTCSVDCAAKRPPLLVQDASHEMPANFGFIQRDDGTRQWAYRGMPLYRYARDSHPGAAYGEGDGWSVAFDPITTPAEMSIASTVVGYVLASANGQTLYVQSGDQGSTTFDCAADCLKTWQPFAAPWGAQDYGHFSVKARGDGVYQWAYNDQPLFLYFGDEERGDLNGDGQDGVWRAMILEPAPPVPEWVTVVGSDGGALYGDADGMTLYTLLEDKNATEEAYRGGNHCDEVCLDRYWSPVVAETKLPPIGNWSVIEKGDETWQWAHKGHPVYTSKLETRPGQLYYTTFRQFQWMKPIMYALPALQGVF